MGTITGKFHQNLLKTVGEVAKTRLCLRTDGLTDGQTDGRTHFYSPLRLTSGDNYNLLLALRPSGVFARAASINSSIMGPSSSGKLGCKLDISDDVA